MDIDGRNAIERKRRHGETNAENSIALQKTSIGLPPSSLNSDTPRPSKNRRLVLPLVNGGIDIPIPVPRTTATSASMLAVRAPMSSLPTASLAQPASLHSSDIAPAAIGQFDFAHARRINVSTGSEALTVVLGPAAIVTETLLAKPTATVHVIVSSRSLAIHSHYTYLERRLK